jgi:hypothetical protein
MLPREIGPISHAFRYVTVDMLRAEGMDAAMLPDDRAKDLILYVSNWINWLTQQWFLPVRAYARVEGRGSCIAHLPNFVPILELFSLRIAKENLFDVTLPEVSYNLKPRMVQMLSYNAGLPWNPRFVTLDGVFGWLEDNFQPLYTKLAAPVASGDRVISLVSTAGIRVGDSLLIGKNPYPDSDAAVVDAIRGNEIAVDAVRCTCAAGDTVTRYGYVPRPIQWATMLLVRDKVTQIGLRGTEDDRDSPRWFADRLQSESVEGYSYSLAGLPVAYGPGGGAWTTGNPEADDLLTQYSCPMLYVGSTSGGIS